MLNSYNPFSGGRYMVVDCGGGTVDITVHEIASRDGHLRELFKATGGPYGSISKCGVLGGEGGQGVEQSKMFTDVIYGSPYNISKWHMAQDYSPSAGMGRLG